jgi:hypothetical protein
MPSDFKGGKTQFAFVSGMPVALYVEPEWGAITVCQYSEEFLASVADPIYFDTESTGDMNALETLMTGYGLVETGEWEAAARAFAQSFLIEPVRVGPLRHLAPCLRKLDRDEEADLVNSEATRLADRLKQSGIMLRVSRHSQPSVYNEELRAQLIEHGLPDEWKFGELLALIKSIVSGYSNRLTVTSDSPEAP